MLKWTQNLGKRIKLERPKLPPTPSWGLLPRPELNCFYCSLFLCVATSYRGDFDTTLYILTRYIVTFMDSLVNL